MRLTRCGIGFGLAKAKSVLSGRHGLLTSGSEVNLDFKESVRAEQAAHRTVALEQADSAGAAPSPQQIPAVSPMITPQITRAGGQRSSATLPTVST
jgi:hypothetical protein